MGSVFLKFERFPDSSLSRRVSEKKPEWSLLGPDANARRSTILAGNCSGSRSASKHVKRASQRFRHASKRRWKRFKRASQRFAAPFSFVSQYASAKRVRERCEARFPALAARRKASPKRLKQAFQRPPHRFTRGFRRLTHRFTRPRQRLLAPFTAHSRIAP